MKEDHLSCSVNAKWPTDGYDKTLSFLVPMFFAAKIGNMKMVSLKHKEIPKVTLLKTKISSWEFKDTPPQCHMPGIRLSWGLITPRRALFPGLAWRSEIALNSHSTPFPVIHHLPPESLAILSRKASQNCSGLASDQGSGYGTWNPKDRAKSPDINRVGPLVPNPVEQDACQKGFIFPQGSGWAYKMLENHHL